MHTASPDATSADSATRSPLPWRLRFACLCYAWAALVTFYLLMGLPVDMTAREAWNAVVLGAFIAASIATLVGIVRRRSYFVRTSILLGILAAFQIIAAMEAVAATVEASPAPARAAMLLWFLLLGSGWVALIVGMICCLPVWKSGRAEG
jgi:hypothetical protein